MAALITEDEYLKLPEFTGRQEFRDGVLIEVPPPRLSHSTLVSQIVNFLHDALDESRVWQEAGFRLRSNLWRIPDVCVTWPTQAHWDDYFALAPMVAIDAASRGNTPDELDRKPASSWSSARSRYG